MKAILDAGPLIALWGRSDVRRDPHYSWAAEIFRTYGGPFLTSESVLCEVGFMTGRAEEIIEAISKGHFIIGVSLEHDAAAITRVLKKYEHCDLADGSIIVLSEKFPELDVLTIDRRHFLTYRRADKTALPLVMP